MFISIILPTYNERSNLPILCHLLINELSKPSTPISRFELVIVDDNSPDGTGAIAQKLASIYGADLIQVRGRSGKLGLGSAYAHGLQYARGEWIILMDVDLSHHPKFIKEMVKKQKETGADVVSGSRYKTGGGVYGWSWKRKLTSRGANLLATVALSPGVSDLTGSFRLYKKTVLANLVSKCITKGYPFQMEMMVRAKEMGYIVAEVPITFVDRVYGESKLGGSEIIGYLKGLCKLVTTIEY